MAEAKTLSQYEVASSKRLKVSVLIILIIIPAAIAAAYFIPWDGMYMLVSVFILVAVMAPFFMVFERRRPKARELMLIVVMSAMTVAVHSLFHIIFPIQIGTAMVIISGIALGPEAGFLIGALSRLICNFYMGQGPWTPWQMFAWGLLGFLAGFIFDKGSEVSVRARSFKMVAGPFTAVVLSLILGYLLFLLFPGNDDTFLGWRVYAFGCIGLIVGLILQKKRLPSDDLTMSVITFFMTVIVYGGIMNLSTVVNSTNMAGGSKISIEGLKLLYISGLPMDLIHGITAAVCVFILGSSIISKLDRIKIKYGIYR